MEAVTPTQVVDEDRIFEVTKGKQIIGGEMGEDGMHFYLEGGMVLIFSGVFVVGVYRTSEQTIQ